MSGSVCPTFFSKGNGAGPTIVLIGGPPGTLSGARAGAEVSGRLPGAPEVLVGGTDGRQAARATALTATRLTPRTAARQRRARALANEGRRLVEGGSGDMVPPWSSSDANRRRPRLGRGLGDAALPGRVAYRPLPTCTIRTGRWPLQPMSAHVGCHRHRDPVPLSRVVHHSPACAHLARHAQVPPGGEKTHATVRESTWNAASSYRPIRLTMRARWTR